MAKSKPVVLLILDGWGYREESQDNAIAQANTPHWDACWQTHPHTLLSASGLDAGLPEHQMGNSEVGHLCLGAGRIIRQDLQSINHAIAQGDFYKNPVLKEAFEYALKANKKVHIMGLLSPGGVHSHEDHMLATLEMAKQMGLTDLYVHAFLDGRDMPPKSAQPSIDLVEQWFKNYGHGKIASLAGRFYAMDRDRRYERTAKAYDCLTQGHGLSAESATEALNASYSKGVEDEFVEPTCIGRPVLIEEDDVVIFINFRADRTRQLSHALYNPNFDGFKRNKIVSLSHFVCMTLYDEKLHARVAFPAPKIPQTLAQVVAENHLTQLRIAETEKYAHVTFFFNGGVEEPVPGETRILIKSPDVTTYDLKPEMSAQEVTETLCEAIRSQDYDLIVCNYANADMVGHTGNMKAAIKAVETLDSALGQIFAAQQDVEAQILITADHGNVEMMRDETSGQAHTAHTCELVPLVYVGPHPLSFTGQATLADIAPTILRLLDITPPKEMTGRNVLQ